MGVPKIYIAYNQGSHRDRSLYAGLERFLKPLIRKGALYLLERPRSIPPKAKGGNWSTAFRQAMAPADTILVLVSQHFLSSDECYQELQACIALARDGQRRLLGVILAPSHLKDSGLESFQLLPHQGQATIAELDEAGQERFWSDFVEHLTAFSQGGLERGPASAESTYYLKKITLDNFKCFERLSISFDHPSVLGGRWHCIAGINGAGKSTVLEAICLCLLGSEKAPLIGPELIGRKCRNNAKSTEIRAVVVNGASGKEQELFLPLTRSGVDVDRFNGQLHLEPVWRELEHALFVSFGASRDFSENKKPEDRLGEVTRRHLSLFDPLEPPVDEFKVLKDVDRGVFLTLLGQMLNLLPDELRVNAGITEYNQLQFSINGEGMPLLELPSGLRSLVICFTGLIREWCRVAPVRAEKGDLKYIQGLVLLDEIDLHLHPRLQRLIVPKLRKHLPGVQWIVTTHSPLVLSSFDQHELTWLKPGREPGPPDRQILGFTPDQIYRLLMETDPESVVAEKYHRFQIALRENRIPDEEDVLSPEAAQVIMGQAIYPEFSETETKTRLAWWREQVKKYKNGSDTT